MFGRQHLAVIEIGVHGIGPAGALGDNCDAVLGTLGHHVANRGNGHALDLKQQVKHPRTAAADADKPDAQNFVTQKDTPTCTVTVIVAQAPAFFNGERRIFGAKRAQKETAEGRSLNGFGGT